MIPLMKNAFIDEQKTKSALAEFILQAPRLSMDAKCLEFEKRFADWQGRKFAVLFNSGGSANLAMLQAMKNLGLLKDNDNVGFSALTWSTNTMPIIQMGMTPVAVDCGPRTLNVMSSDLQERLRTSKLAAMFITNALGFAGDLGRIKNLCREKGIILIEDSCEALGSELPSGKTGNFGMAASFSFFVAHHMSTIEGGMACTDDAELAEMLRIVRANGWDRNLEPRQQAKWRDKFAVKNEFESKYTFYDLGFNLRPTEITGFLGLRQLEALEGTLIKRESNFKLLDLAARQNDELITVDCAHLSRVANFAFPVLCKTQQVREKYLAKFTAAGVEIRPMIAGNIQRQPFYGKYVRRMFELPGTDFIHDCGFYCGNYPELTDGDLAVIRDCLKK